MSRIRLESGSLRSILFWVFILILEFEAFFAMEFFPNIWRVSSWLKIGWYDWEHAEDAER